jgi:hypothetical protein
MPDRGQARHPSGAGSGRYLPVGHLLGIARTRRYGMAYKQSDTSPVLAPGCEELKCDVVGISKRQCRVGRRVHDATVGDAEFVKTDFPCL